MSTTKKSANPNGAKGRRRWIVLQGAFLGWVLAELAGSLLDVELRALHFFFIPLSSLACGLAALGAWSYFAGLAEGAARRRYTGAAFAGLAFSFTLLLALYAGFVERVEYAGHTKSVAFLVGWARSENCNCSAADGDATCIQALGLDVEAVRSCFKGRWVIEIALALSYLLTLGSLGALSGLLTAPRKGAPAAPGYLDYDVWIDHRSGSTYRAKAWSGGAGFEATVDFTLPQGLERGEPFRFAGADAVRGGPGDGEAESAGPEEVGEELFRTVFQGELLKSFLGCLEQAKDGPGLRIRLRLNDAPQLAGLPWEYLCEARGRGFLALSPRTPVVRYLELSESVGTLLVEPPLRVLAVISTPKGYEELAQADEEWRRLREALKPLLDSGLIEIERLAHPTRETLAARLKTGCPVHVLHFVGHGGWSELRGEGVLVFEDEDGQGAPLSGQSLAYLLQDHPSLRLAVLNACNGARASREDAFAGTAQVLVQHGVPAVVAMQAEVTDVTACRFAERFYQALAAGLPVDACVGEVRRALAAEANPEWGTPVLYLRAADSRLFAVPGGSD
ncbi:MAG TPA: CHAT domain-containing protein [Thermoanaerobaculia bacterium]|nr:CHAT domain-containing protein [Thermoanaerobaculia bacterium]